MTVSPMASGAGAELKVSHGRWKRWGRWRDAEQLELGHDEPAVVPALRPEAVELIQIDRLRGRAT